MKKLFVFLAGSHSLNWKILTIEAIEFINTIGIDSINLSFGSIILNCNIIIERNTATKDTKSPDHAKAIQDKTDVKVKT